MLSCMSTFYQPLWRMGICAVQAAQQAMQQHGVRGLYAGLKPSLVGDMIGTGLGFFAYEQANGIFEHVTGRRPQAIEKGFVGAASAMVVMTGTMPLELIQRRMQVGFHCCQHLTQSLCILSVLSTKGPCKLVI